MEKKENRLHFGNKIELK